MQDPYKTIELENHTVEIYVDHDPVNPREWDNLGTMVCSHSQYNLGDNQVKNQDIFLIEFEHVLDEDKDGYGWYEWAIYNNLPDDIREKLLNAFYNENIVLPLFLYDHGGITMNTTGFYCPWDSGQVGYIYVSKDQVREEYGWKNLTKKRIAQIEGYLRSEVEIYDYYIMGRAYGYHLRCNDCKEHLDSCWGFYGEDWQNNGVMDYVKDWSCPCQKAKVFQNMGAGL